jgi:TPR repeat protein
MKFERFVFFLSFTGLCSAALVSSAASVFAEPPMSVREAEQKQQALTRETNPEQFAAGVEAYDAGDYARAYELWLPLAKGRDLAAMRNVAHLLRKGLGVTRDPQRALQFYEQAGEAGLGNAQLNAAFMYLGEEGVFRDEEAAADWFEKAAHQGSATAQYNLGVMLERGMGRVKDQKQAIAYYRLAAKDGHDMAINRLAGLENDPENATPPELETQASIPAN